MKLIGVLIFNALIVCGLVPAEPPGAPKLAQHLPVLYWTEGIETAATLKRHGIEMIAAPPEKAAAWRNAGFRVVAIAERELDGRQKLLVPRIAGRANVASATSRPWIDANGWRFARKPAGKFYYDLAQNARNRTQLAVAEAFAYKADAVLKIDPSELAQFGEIIKFIRELPGENYSSLADIGVIDNGSDTVAEVLNLLTRRNLLFKIIPAHSSKYRVNIKLGTKEYPESAAADPSEFAQKIRRRLGDENRTVRIYGSETVIARLTGDSRNFRLHLLNYSAVEMEGLRVRLLHANKSGTNSWAFGYGTFHPETPLTENGAFEFSIPRMGIYAVIDGHLTQ